MSGAAIDPVSDPAALPSAPTDDLWTADSERSGDGVVAVEKDPAAPVEAAPVTPESDATDRDDKGQFKPRSGKPRNDPAARVQQATAKEAAAKEDARLSRERADRLEHELAEIRRSTPPREEPRPAAKPLPDGKPTWGSFEHQIGSTFETWADAQDAYSDARDAWKEAQTQHRTTLEAFTSGEAHARTKYPDYDAVARRADVPVSGVMMDAIHHSSLGHDIAYYLGSHPEVSAQLMTKTRSLGRDAVTLVRDHLESLVTAGAVAVLDSASPVRPSAAKAPINRVGGTANATPVDPDDLEFGPEYIRLENAKDKKRQEASRW